MTTYNTGNPLGSTAVKDLYDNAENFDIALNAPAVDNWTDRLGRSRKTWTGMERKFDTFLNSSNAEFQQFLLSSGYQDLGDYAAGVQIASRNQIFRRDGELYRAGPGLDLPYTLTGDWATEGSNFVAVGDAALRQELSYRLPTDVLAHGAVGDGTTLNDAAFQDAEVAADVIYVPEGEFRLSTPMALGYTAAYYGPGVLKFDNAEWWRRGGSSGSVSVPEHYTLFFEYEGAQGPTPADNGISVTFDGVAQSISWSDKYTVLAPGSTAETAVIINIVNGRLRLGPVPEQVRSYNTFSNGGGRVIPSLASPTADPTGMNNVALGARALRNVTTSGNNVAVGSRSLTSLEGQEGNNTAVGFQALYRAVSGWNTAIGSIALEWLTTGVRNTGVGHAALGGMTTGEGNTAVGNEACAELQLGSFNVAVGHRAIGNPGPTADFGSTTAVGAFALDFCRGSANTGIGYRSLCGEGNPGGMTGINNTAVGAFTARAIRNASQNVIIGTGSGNALKAGSSNVVIGFEAMISNINVGGLIAIGLHALRDLTTGERNTAVGSASQQTVTEGSDNTTLGSGTLQAATTAASNTAVGSRSQESLTTGSGNSTLGFEAGRFMTTATVNSLFGFRAGRQLTTAVDNVALGADALQFETTGSQSTALGRRALRLLQDGNNHLGVSNATGVGFDAAVSGSNQVQLGNSATTTYVYGTVQNRSDARDKADIQDTVLGLGFINALRPVDFKWDMREDYITVEEYAVDVEQEYEEPSAMLGTDGRPIMVTKTRIVQEMRERVVRRERDGSKKRKRFHHGLLSHQVKEVADRLGVDFGGYQDHTVNGGCDVQSLGYDEFIAPLIRAVQELSTENSNLRSRIEALEARP